MSVFRTTDWALRCESLRNTLPVGPQAVLQTAKICDQQYNRVDQLGDREHILGHALQLSPHHEPHFPLLGTGHSAVKCNSPWSKRFIYFFDRRLFPWFSFSTIIEEAQRFRNVILLSALFDIDINLCIIGCSAAKCLLQPSTRGNRSRLQSESNIHHRFDRQSPMVNIVQESLPSPLAKRQPCQQISPAYVNPPTTIDSRH